MSENVITPESTPMSAAPKVSFDMEALNASIGLIVEDAVAKNIEPIYDKLQASIAEFRDMTSSTQALYNQMVTNMQAHNRVMARAFGNTNMQV